jgi:MFS family permease
MEKPRLSFWQIWNMSFGFLGIQFGWGLQMANMSATYEYLGARPVQIPILWLAAPLTGLIVQPIVGHMSDRTWNRLGRRRPAPGCGCRWHGHNVAVSRLPILPNFEQNELSRNSRA